MNTGSRLWISSEEMSMNSEPNPSAQMPAGSARQPPEAPRGPIPVDGLDMNAPLEWRDAVRWTATRGADWHR